MEAAEIFTALRQAANDDELTTPLAPALHRARTRASELLTRSARSQTRPVPDRGQTSNSGGGSNADPDGSGQIRPQRTAPGPNPEAGARPTGPIEQGGVVTDSDDLTAALETLREVARRNPGSRIEITWRVRQ